MWRDKAEPREQLDQHDETGAIAAVGDLDGDPELLSRQEGDKVTLRAGLDEDAAFRRFADDLGVLTAA